MATSLRHATAVVAVGLCCTAPLDAQLASPRSVPATYAITNARLVPVSSPVIEKGTIVVRDGLIVAIGATVVVPGDARVIDGTGLTVYPGLIDAYGSLGVPNAPAAGGGGGGRGGGGGGAAAIASGGAAANSNYPAGLQPEVSVTTLLKSDDEAFSGPTSAGITTALTGTGSGIFQGQSAVINLAGADVNAMVVKASVSQNIGFSPLRGGYPSSLMGVFAALRQQLLDAQHYRDVKVAYDKNPRGMQRPEFDPSLEALQPVLARTQPVILYASTQREIERALDLAKEFTLRPIIAGGGEAHLMAARLKAENVPVLLTLNFPRRTAAPSADADPDPIRVLRERVDAPKNAGRLAQAGVKFAFQSGGLSSWADFTANVQRAVDNGLSADAAVKALTLQSAEILGVSDRLGSLETGKIANLTITRGDLLDRGRVTQLFIDGKPVAVRTPAAGAGGGAATATGAWTVTVTLDGVDLATTMSLRQEGTRLLGSMQGSLGIAELQNGTIGTDGELRFTVTVTLKEGTEEATFIGTLDGNAVHGRMAIVGHSPGSFSGTRPQRAGGPPSGGAPRTPPGAR